MYTNNLKKIYLQSKQKIIKEVEWNDRYR